MQQRVLWILAIGLAVAPTHSASASDHSVVTLWEASSGDLPSEQRPLPYELFDTATPEDPVLSGGVLTLATSTNSEIMSYKHEGATVSIPDDLVIEARMRFVSGSSSTPARTPAYIYFTTAPSVGNTLQITQDEIHLRTSNTTIGSPAFVDTDDTFHDYRIEVSSGAITVYHDGVQALTGSTFNDTNSNGLTPRVGFGNASILSQGVSEWESFQHNAQPPIVTATWNDVFAIQAHDGAIHPALLVGLSLGTATVTSQTTNSITFTYSNIDPNSDVQINLATYDAPFYPPDPVHVMSSSRIEVEMDQSGTMFTLGIDFSSTTGEVLDPASIIGFNPQPEPPAGSIYGFNPQPEPPKLGDGLGVFMPLSGGTGAPGSTQISLTVEILDGGLAPLPLSLVGVATPALSTWGHAIVILSLAASFALAAGRSAGRAR